MRLEIMFHHMDRSEGLENFVSEKLESLIHVAHRQDAHFIVRLSTEQSFHQRNSLQFKCEIEVRYPHAKDVFVHKTDADIHVAIAEALDTVRTSIKKEDNRRLDARHRPRPQAAGL
jgi:ribosome-associated translation inhibitor RaiA